ncbi:hypothetical protein D3C80_1236850 [compost metagenome]
MVEGQGCLGVGGTAEHHQAQAVFRALADKVLDHRLDRAHARHRVAVGALEVDRLHGLGNVDGQHQVAHRLFMLLRWLDQYRAGDGHHQQCPHQPVQDQLPGVVTCAGYAGLLTADTADGFEEWHADGTARLDVGWQPAVAQHGQRQQDQQPGIVKLPHDDAPPRFCTVVPAPVHRPPPGCARGRKRDAPVARRSLLATGCGCGH